MIAIDTSALVYILLGEEEAQSMANAIQNDDQPIMSAASILEFYLVLERKLGPETRRVVEKFIEVAQIKIISVDEAQIRIATTAMSQYRRLNYGDLFSYALAKDRNVPLLFKGNDFTQTDLQKVEL